MLVTKRKTLTPSSVQKILIPLREMLTHAVEDGVLDGNPAARIGRFLQKRHESEKEIDPPGTGGVDTISCRDSGTHSGPLPIVSLSRTHGHASWKSVGLQWGDIDFRGRFLAARRNYVRRKVTSPKNGKTRRVDMSQHLTEVLHNLPTQRQAEAVLQGMADMSPWVFCSTTGGLIDKDNLRRLVLHRCLERSDLRRIRIHDLRHTCASLLIQQGESLAHIKDRLRHHSIQVTVDIYGHLVPDGNKAAVDRLDDAPICNLSATAMG